MRINSETSLPNEHSKPSNYYHLRGSAKIGVGRGMGPPNDHTVHPSFALLPSYNPPKVHHPLSPFPWFPTHPDSPLPHSYPAAVHNTPQVNGKLRWLCLGWWSGGFPSNSVRMPHIHSPLAYSNQPSIIDAHTPPSNTHKWSVHNKHTHTHPNIHTRHTHSESIYHIEE